MSFSEQSLGMGSYPSAEKQSVYSTAPADWAKYVLSIEYSVYSEYMVSIEYGV